MDNIYILIFLVGGFLTGIINTLAGNGSAITLSLMMFTGMPANIANATNRIGAIVQTITAVLSLQKTKRTRFLLGDSLWFIVPSVIGSIIGALIAVEVNPVVLKKIIGFIMLFLLSTMLYSPKKWSGGTDTKKPRKTILNWVLIFITAIYGGFLQMGIGIMLLSILVLLTKYSLRDANIVKLLIATVFVIPAFLVFALSGDMDWIPGLVLAIGQGIGAWVGARYILFLPKANQMVKIVLIVILSFSSFSLLGGLDLLKNLFAL